MDFLERFGYPVPLQLSAAAQPKVMVVTEAASAMEELEKLLDSDCHIRHFDCPVKALLAIGKDRPSVVVIDIEHPEVEASSLIPKLAAVEPPKPVVVIYAPKGGDEMALNAQGADAVLLEPSREELAQNISELLTQRTKVGVGAEVE